MLKFPDLYNCKLAVIGLGYVGLPLAIEFAKKEKCNITKRELKREVIGFDLNNFRVKELLSKYDRTGEINNDELINLKNIIFTSDKELLKEAELFIVTVPTPINKHKEPDLSFLEKACALIGDAIKDKNSAFHPIIIFESTVFPGATEEICASIISQKSLLTYKKDFFCGYSPERINPGDKTKRLKDIVKVTSGCNKECANWVNSLYGSIIDAGTYNASSIKVAEAAKVIENTQRDLNIALVNELSVIFSKMGIDSLDVLDTASSKWNFMNFRPGFVGGHCIGVDPYYLTWKAEQFGYKSEILLSGRKVNENMSRFVFNKIISNLSHLKKDFRFAKVLICGISFKEDCPDIRNSKVFDLINLFKINKFEVDIYDPVADLSKLEGIKLLLELPSRKFYDVIVLAVPHIQFKKISYDKFNLILKNKGIIFDLKGILEKKEENIIRP